MVLGGVLFVVLFVLVSNKPGDIGIFFLDCALLGSSLLSIRRCRMKNASNDRGFCSCFPIMNICFPMAIHDTRGIFVFSVMNTVQGSLFGVSIVRVLALFDCTVPTRNPFCGSDHR